MFQPLKARLTTKNIRNWWQALAHEVFARNLISLNNKNPELDIGGGRDRI